MTQNQRIMHYLHLYGSITVREAFERLSINSPTKRLSELYMKGLVKSEDVQVYDEKDGKKVYRTHYAKYTLTKAGE